jgi:hypothetical protein
MINKIRQAIHEKEKINKKVDKIAISVNSFVYLIDDVRKQREVIGLHSTDGLAERITQALVTRDFHKIKRIADEMQFMGRKFVLIDEETTVVIP